MLTTEREVVKTVLYPLWPKQTAAMRLLGLDRSLHNPNPVEEMLYGGEAGGGKSYLLRAIGADLCSLTPGVTVALFRRTYPELYETHIRSIQNELPPECGRFGDERHEWRWPNGSILAFRYCEREADVFRYQSAEWDALLIDEATHFSEDQIRYLRSRVRSTRPGWRPLQVYATNPGGLGHMYFKTAYVDAAPAGTVFTAPPEDGGMRRVFHRARLDDNPALDKEYRRRLEGIADPALRRALLDGDWDVFAGQFFAEWRRDTHVVEPFAIPETWPRWRAIDWGYGAPFGCLWATRDPQTRRKYIYREVYQPGVIDSEQARLIVALSANERIRYTVGDPSMWNRQPNGTSIAQIYLNNGVQMAPANNDRAAGWQRVHEELQGHEDDPPLGVFSTCVNLIRTIPSMIHDKIDVEDIDTHSDDHLLDCLRYALMGERNAIATFGVRDFKVLA